MTLVGLLRISPFISILVAACSVTSSDTELQAELLEMGRIDQEAGERAYVFMQDLPDSAEEFVAAIEEQNEVYAQNFIRLEAIVAEYGWPGRRLVGEEASGAALIMLQHADMEHQKKYLPLLRAAAADDEIPGYYLARLEDGIRQGEGRNQVYGTRVVSDSDGMPVLYPIEDPENLDERREAAGLPSIAEQLEQMESEIGMPIDRGNLAPE